MDLKVIFEPLVLKLPIKIKDNSLFEVNTMKKWTGFLAIAALAIMVLTPYSPFGTASKAWACNMGTPGGGDFTKSSTWQDKPASNKLLTENEAYEIITRHLALLNPKLKVGHRSDAGTHFRYEIKVQDQRVEYLTVEKSTGLIRSTSQ